MEWYEAEVRVLEAAAAQQPKGSHPPVFYGSSSIRLWETLGEDVGRCVLNLGFGGSTLEACDYFFGRLVPPVNPRSLLLYAGDNDLGDGRGVEEVLGWFRSLADKVAVSLGAIPFGFVSIKPSPARYAIVDRIELLNRLIRMEIECRAGGYYVDAYGAMLDGAGKPRPEFFQADGLHMNREGYRLWSRLLKPHHNQIFIK